MRTKKKIAVAMSGGVDSSVAAALVKDSGNEVIGITMCLNLPDRASGSPACCGTQGIADAKRVCDILRMPHYVLNFSREMETSVIADFIREYSRGRTPNPCVRCNELLKFDALLARVKALGFDYLATGHYSRIDRRDGRYYLKKAVDPAKDQSYFLYRLSQEKLKQIMFPLGDLSSKQAVREIARQRGLPVAEKKESQEICFISGDYRSFMGSRGVTGLGPGDIIDRGGNVIGRHKGLPYYTIGQRNGLGIAKGYPVYVAGIDLGTNRLIVDGKEALMKREFVVTDVVFPSGKPRKRGFSARIRHLSREAQARIRIDGNTVTACFQEPQFAITPGQSAVFYDGDTVRCGGIIEKVIG